VTENDFSACLLAIIGGWGLRYDEWVMSFWTIARREKTGQKSCKFVTR
jgi:hypothetical protein